MTKLFDLIISLNEEQQRYLLKKADDLIFGEKRTYARKACKIPVKYANYRRIYNGFIINISQSGCFIETQSSFFVREKILVAIKMDEYNNPFTIKGEVAHANRLGIGIEFNKFDIHSSKILSNFLSKIH